MEKIYSFNFANLGEWQTINQIVKQENLDFGREYKFRILCKEGFREISLTIDKDGVWGYGGVIMPDDDTVLVGKTTYSSDGAVQYEEEILTKDEYKKALEIESKWQRYAEDGKFLGCVEYEDLLAN